MSSPDRYRQGYKVIANGDVAVEQTDDVDLLPQASTPPRFWIVQSVMVALSLVQIGLLTAQLVYRIGQPQTGPFRFISLAIQELVWMYIVSLSVVKMTMDVENIYQRAFLNTHQKLFYLVTMVTALVDWQAAYVLEDGSHYEYLLLVASVAVTGVLFGFALFQHVPGDLASVDGRTISAEAKASWWETVQFSWLNTILEKGYERPLDDEDLWELPGELRVYNALDIFHQLRRRRLVWMIVSVHKWELMVQAMLAMLGTAFTFAPPFFMQRLMDRLQDPTHPAAYPIYYDALGFALGGLLTSAVSQRSLWIGRQISTGIRATLSAEIFAKTLKRRDATGAVSVKVNTDDNEEAGEDATPKEEDNADVGKVTNLLNVDTISCAEILAYLDYFYAMPIKSVVSFVLLYGLLGWSILVGIVFIVATNTVTGFLAGRYQRATKKVSEAGDARVSIITEMLNGMRIVKLFSWEQRFQDKIYKARDNELQLQLYLVIESVIMWTMNFIGSSFFMLVTFAVYTTLQGEEMTSSLVFTSLALFGIFKEGSHAHYSVCNIV